MLPAAARAMAPSAAASALMFSAANTLANCASITSGSMFFKLNCKQRDKTVTGIFFASVVASRNFTCSGGSSSVFNKALKLWPVSMCTSSIRYTLQRPWPGRNCALLSNSRVSSTPVRDAASTSIRSMKRPSAMAVQASQVPQGVEVTPDSQLKHAARMRANVVLPTPRVPVNR